MFALKWEKSSTTKKDHRTKSLVSILRGWSSPTQIYAFVAGKSDGRMTTRNISGFIHSEGVVNVSATGQRTDWLNTPSTTERFEWGITNGVGIFPTLTVRTRTTQSVVPRHNSPSFLVKGFICVSAEPM
jgi:hypothetical protein